MNQLKQQDKEIQKAHDLIDSGQLTPKQIEKVEALIYRLISGSRETLKDLNLIKFSK